MADTDVAGSGAAQAGPQAGYAGYIRASHALFPRGGMWVFAAWYAAMAAVLIWAIAPGAWPVRIFYLVALAVAATAMVLVQRANAAQVF